MMLMIISLKVKQTMSMMGSRERERERERENSLIMLLYKIIYAIIVVLYIFKKRRKILYIFVNRFVLFTSSYNILISFAASLPGTLPL